MAGCLGAVILLIIIGAIGKHFGGFSAFIVFLGLVGIGYWADKQEKAKKNLSNNEVTNNVEIDLSTFTNNKSINQPKQPINKSARLPKSSQKKSSKVSLTKPIVISEIKGNLNKICFSYTNSKGEFSTRIVKVRSVDSKYLEGICLSANEERTFRWDRILGGITLDDTGEYLTIDEYLKLKTKGRIKKHYQDSDFEYTDNEQLEICFTGFSKEKREELELLAELEDFKIRKSITKNLTFLVMGNNAGSTKIEKAINNGATLLTEDEFHEMLDTGEIPG